MGGFNCGDHVYLTPKGRIHLAYAGNERSHTHQQFFRHDLHTCTHVPISWSLHQLHLIRFKANNIHSHTFYQSVLLFSNKILMAAPICFCTHLRSYIYGMCWLRAVQTIESNKLLTYYLYYLAIPKFSKHRNLVKKNVEKIIISSM